MDGNIFVLLEISWLSGVTSASQCFKMSAARCTIFLLFVSLISSICFKDILAIHGPTLSTVSNADASMEVSILFKLDGIIIWPTDFPLLESIFTWILPMRPVFCNSLKSNSSPNNPSVCPNNAPTTSGLYRPS